LAGGLTPENVARAAQQVHPFAVDCVSGVEASKGIKNPERVQAFTRAARPKQSQQ
ncbi:N-(5'-phosphoribosyl)anthranilate isomerase, partial [bacterium]